MILMIEFVVIGYNMTKKYNVNKKFDNLEL